MLLNHDVFYNREHSNFDELTSYLPVWWRDISEMNANNEFAGHTLDKLAGDLENLIIMQFIDGYNEELTARHERFIGIETDRSKSLEERKTLIKAYELSTSKISRESICQVVSTFTKCNSDSWLERGRIVVDMIFKDDMTAYMNNIRDILRQSIPAHLDILYKGTVENILSKIANRSATRYIIKFSTPMDSLKLKPDAYPIIRCDAYTESKSALQLNTKNELWYLDGTYTLNGDKILDPYEIWEEL